MSTTPNDNDRPSTEENLRSALRFHIDRNDRIRQRAERAEAEVAELRARLAEFEKEHAR